MRPPRSSSDLGEAASTKDLLRIRPLGVPIEGGALMAAAPGPVTPGVRAQGLDRALRAGVRRPGSKDFQDPRQEWRRSISELLGTFFLVLAAGGGDDGPRFRTRSVVPRRSSRPG